MLYNKYVICFMNRFIILFLLLIPGMSRSQNLSFDGTNDYVSTANTSDLSGNSTASIQVWIYKTSDPASGIILYHGSGDAGRCRGLLISTADQKLC